MNIYSALLLVTATLHVSVPAPTLQHPDNYSNNTCTAVFISPNELLTAAHCVRLSRGQQWIKTNENKSLSVIIEKTNYQKDLALLKIKDKNFRHVFAGIGSPVQKADEVYTVNSGEDFEKTFNHGMVNNIIIDDENGTLSILHSATILPGASGSGLFNYKHELIGINTTMIRSFGTAVDVMEINEFLDKR